jgi:ABC-type glycerol-3-phosphate transport system substrate-binding protein
MRKKHLIYRMIAAFLLVLFAVFALPACGDKEGAGDGTDATSGGPDTGETQADVTGENTDVYRNIDRTKKYDGSFRVLSYDAKTWNIYLTADTNRGTLLDDAAFRRNSEVEELLGVTVETVLFPSGDLIARIQSANASGAPEDSYDLVCFWATTNIASLLTTGAVEDWRSLGSVNLSEPWYNQSANEAFLFRGRQYIAVSDLTYPVQQHFRFLCNLEMLSELRLKSPYALVDSGDWTADELLALTKDVYTDLDGSGTKTDLDRYGLAITVNGTSRVINNWGQSPVKVSDDGFLINLSGDLLQGMVEKMNEIQTAPDTWTYPNVDYTVFNSGRALFEVYSSDPDNLRDISFNYAYLPYPKYSKDQENYITVTHGGIMAVPCCCADLDRSGAIIEALSAASYKYLTEAFVETYFTSRILRDADSVRMYRLMRDTAFFDVSRYVDPSGKLSGLSYYTSMLKNGRTDLERQYTSEGLAIVKNYQALWEGIKGD